MESLLTQKPIQQHQPLLEQPASPRTDPEMLTLNIVKKSLLSLDDLNDKYFKKWGYFAAAFFILYLLTGQLVFRWWAGFTPLDTIYFTVVTFATVGYGDIVVRSPSLRLFVAFYILIGVGVGASLISAVNDHLVNHNQKINAKKSEQTVRDINVVTETSNRNPLKNSFIGNILLKLSVKRDLKKSVYRKVDEKVTVPSNDQQSEVSMKQPEHGLNRGSFNRQFDKMQSIYIASYEEELQLLARQTYFNCACILALVAIGAGVMAGLEELNVDASIYWSVVTLCTVGYGDITPKTDIGKIFTTLFILTGCGFMAKTLSTIVQYPILLRVSKNEMQVLNQFGKHLSRERLEALWSGDSVLTKFHSLRRQNDELSKSEFCLIVLQLMSKIDPKHIAIVSGLFDLLDLNRKGYLDKSTINELMQTLPTEEEVQKMIQQEKLDRIQGSLLRLRFLYPSQASDVISSPITLVSDSSTSMESKELSNDVPRELDHQFETKYDYRYDEEHNISKPLLDK